MSRRLTGASCVSSLSSPVSMIESLETRRLLSTVLSSNGVLRVNGTDGSDLISIYLVRNNTAQLQTKVRNVVEGTFAVSSIKQIIIHGLGGHDRILFDSNNGAIKIVTKIYGEEGNDSIQGGASKDRITGGNGNDTLAGGSGDDIIYGEVGDDSLSGGAGNDYMGGGIGRDFMEGNIGNDRMFGNEGNDTLQGNAGNDELYGMEDGDTIFGGSGNDKISGGDDGDFLQGEDGNDYIFGGAGNDFILGNAGDDDLSGGKGTDTVNGLDGNDDYYDPEDGEFGDDAGPNALGDNLWIPSV